MRSVDALASERHLPRGTTMAAMIATAATAMIA
jgi:hypothetical protein